MHPDLKGEWIIWRLILAKVATLDEMKSGVYTLADILKLNALLDAQTDIQSAINKHHSKKGGKNR